MMEIADEYQFFCLDCEADRQGSRVPLKSDFVEHILTKCHLRIIPISQALPSIKYKNVLPVFNITFSKRWNKKLIVSYKKQTLKLLKEEPDKVIKEYKKPKQCLKFNCSFVATSPPDMLHHIRQHIKNVTDYRKLNEHI